MHMNQEGEEDLPKVKDIHRLTLKPSLVCHYMGQNPTHEVDREKASSVMQNMFAKFESLKNSPFYSNKMMEDHEIIHDRKLLQKLGQESRKMIEIEEEKIKNSTFQKKMKKENLVRKYLQLKGRKLRPRQLLLHAPKSKQPNYFIDLQTRNGGAMKSSSTSPLHQLRNQQILNKNKLILRKSNLAKEMSQERISSKLMRQQGDSPSVLYRGKSQPPKTFNSRYESPEKTLLTENGGGATEEKLTLPSLSKSPGKDATDNYVSHSFFKDEKLMKYVQKKFKFEPRHLMPSLSSVGVTRRPLKQIRSVNEFLPDYQEDSDEDELIFEASRVLSPKRSYKTLRDVKDRDFSLETVARSMKKQIDHQYSTIKKQTQLEPIKTDRLLESESSVRSKKETVYASVPVKRPVGTRSFTPDFISERRGLELSKNDICTQSTEKLKEILQKSKEYLKGTKGYNELNHIGVPVVQKKMNETKTRLMRSMKEELSRQSNLANKVHKYIDES